MRIGGLGVEIGEIGESGVSDIGQKLQVGWLAIGKH